MIVTVQEALAEFYRENNFGDDGGVSKKVAWIKFGFFSIPIPNTESRKNNVVLHDLGHLVNGFDTTWKGESSVSAWEIASGGWGKHYFLWFLTLWAMGLGVVFYTKQTFLSFKKGVTMRNALTCHLSINEMLKMPLSGLKSKLNNHPPNKQNAYLWMTFSALIFVLPFIIGIGLFWILLGR